MDLAFLKSQFTTVPYPTQSFQDQVIIVTGANVGLGLEAARHFTRLGAARVILACRSIAKGEAACRDIEHTAGRKGVCETWMVDMVDFDSIKEFAQKAAELPRLDILVENAGIAQTEYELVSGMERNITVNVLGTMFMALSFLPILRKSAKKTGLLPKLSIVGSEVHAWVSR
jgi:retinol dehydrogenase-12